MPPSLIVNMLWQRVSYIAAPYELSQNYQQACCCRISRTGAGDNFGDIKPPACQSCSPGLTFTLIWDEQAVKESKPLLADAAELRPRPEGCLSAAKAAALERGQLVEFLCQSRAFCIAVRAIVVCHLPWRASHEHTDTAQPFLDEKGNFSFAELCASACHAKVLPGPSRLLQFQCCKSCDRCCVVHRCGSGHCVPAFVLCAVSTCHNVSLHFSSVFFLLSVMRNCSLSVILGTSRGRSWSVYAGLSAAAAYWRVRQSPCCLQRHDSWWSSAPGP